MTGKTEDGAIVTVQVVPDGSPAGNWGFDVTPARLVTGLITERGVCAASPEGLKGKVIGVQTSTVSSSYLKKYYEKIADVRYYDTQDSVNADLVAGRIDLMLADGIAVKSFLDSADARAAGIVSKGEVPYDPVFGRGVGAGLRKEDTALKAQIDEAIGKLLASDDYKQLSNKYFGLSVAPKQQ